jgi:uncharacterized protein YbaP (TraB family)
MAGKKLEKEQLDATLTGRNNPPSTVDLKPAWELSCILAEEKLAI